MKAVGVIRLGLRKMIQSKVPRYPPFRNRVKKELKAPNLNASNTS